VLGSLSSRMIVSLVLDLALELGRVEPWEARDHRRDPAASTIPVGDQRLRRTVRVDTFSSRTPMKRAVPRIIATFGWDSRQPSPPNEMGSNAAEDPVRGWRASRTLGADAWKPVPPGSADLVRDFGGVGEHLRRDAADVQTRTAERVTVVDQGDVEAVEI